MIFDEKTMQFASFFLFLSSVDIHQYCHFDEGEMTILRKLALKNPVYFQCNSKAKQVFSPLVMLNVAVV